MKIAFALLVLWINLALAQFALAGIRGTINDPDGFTNLRAKPAENAVVVARVKSGEVFQCEYVEAESKTWWKVTLASGKTGWMHSSRIRMVVMPKDLEVAENDEAVTYARARGADFLKLMRGAAKGDAAAMQEFFALGCDGAAQETHVNTVIGLIHIIGDDKFSKFLGRQSASYRRKVADYVTDDAGWLPFEAIPYMKRNFPKTAKLLFPG